MSDHEEDVLPPQFVLVFQDHPETGELEIAGVQRPETFVETSPAHLVGAFVRDNIDEIVARVHAALGRREASIVMPASQSGLILPPRAKV